MRFRAIRRDIARIKTALQDEGRMSEQTTDRTRRKTRTGVVTSDKMTKTVTVALVRRFAHPQYGKQMMRTSTVKARDEAGRQDR